MNDVLFPIIAGDFIILATITALIYATRQFQYSRMIVFGTIGVAFIAELALGYLLFTSKQLRRDAEKLDQFDKATREAIKKQELLLKSDDILKARVDAKVPPLNKDLVVKHASLQVYKYIEKDLVLDHLQTLLVATTTRFNIENQPADFYNAIVNLRKINNIPRINKFFEEINQKLPYGGIFIGCVTTNKMVKKRMLRSYPPLINYFLYLPFYIWKRVMPKLPITKKFYFFITKGRNRLLSKAEAFGRLYSCGFEIISEEDINDELYFTARKIQEPAYDYRPTYGAFIRLKRVGKNGKTIFVYKMRTMYPYSEYLQQYVYENSNLQKGGKFNKDFRVNTMGKFMRRFWIDELPMLINLLRGDIKLVGVRPLSQQYFELYDKDLKAMRTRFRPGLIPPFYADMPSTLEEIQDSERKYLESYNKKPFMTDCRYLGKAVYNILFKKARSN